MTHYTIYVGFFINMLCFKQQPVAVIHNLTSCPEFNLCSFQCWQGVRSSWFWSSARAWWCLWMYPCVAILQSFSSNVLVVRCHIQDPVQMKIDLTFLRLQFSIFLSASQRHNQELFTVFL